MDSKHALTVLSRLSARTFQTASLEQALSDRLPLHIDAALQVALETGGPIGQVLARCMERQADPELALQVKEVCDAETFRDSVPLREVALVATWQVLATSLSLWQPRPTQRQRSWLARLGLDLGLRLSELERNTEAVPAIEKAVHEYRELAHRRPAAFLPKLALSLNNLSVIFGKLGRFEESLKAAREAVEILESLASERPSDLLEQARFLDTLGAVLSSLGRWDEALAAGEKALVLLGRIRKALPDAATLSDRSRCTIHQGARLSAVGRVEEALEISSEALDFVQQLTDLHRYTHLPDLAIGLHNLGTELGRIGRREEASSALQKAVGLYRELVRHHPEFQGDLAESLQAGSALAADLGDLEGAVAAGGESIEIFHQLAAGDPAAWNAKLALALLNLGRALAERGNLEEAQRVTQESADLRRQLATEYPEAFETDLAISLNNLAAALRELGRPEQALPLTREAIEIYRQHAPAKRSPHLAGLAQSLNNLSIQLDDLGQSEEALKASAESVAIRRRLARRQQDTFLADLARSLSVQGAILGNLDRLEEAVNISQKADRIFQRLARAPSPLMRRDQAINLDNLATSYRELAHWKKASKAFQRAAELWRELAQKPGFQGLPELASSLQNAAECLDEQDHAEEATPLFQEVVKLYRRLARRDVSFAPSLAFALRGLGARQHVPGWQPAARRALEESIRILRRLVQQEPNALLPELAVTLGLLGQLFIQMRRPREALAPQAEAIRLLEPFAQQWPDEFSAWLSELQEDRQRAIEQLQHVPGISSRKRKKPRRPIADQM